MKGKTVRWSKVSCAGVVLALSACAAEAPPRVHPTASVWGPYPSGQLDLTPPLGQLCLVSEQSCLSMNAPRAAPCLASPERCAAAGKLHLVGAASTR
jgi:hypothetical protein